MNDVIYLDSDDEITSVIERLKSSTLPSVVLVVPRGSSIAQSIVNLKILKRSAEETGKEVCLVTSDRITRNIGSQVGITVYSKISEADKPKPSVSEVQAVQSPEDDGSGQIRINSYIRYDKKGESDLAEADTRPAVSEVEEKKPECQPFIASTTVTRQPTVQEKSLPRVKESVIRSNKKPIRPKRALVLLTACMAGAVVLSYVLLPNASATLQLKAEPYSRDVEIKADRSAKAINSLDGTIPGSVLDGEKELSKNFPTTGKKDVGKKATGKITVLNSYDSIVHKFTKGTKFTYQGKVFLAGEDFSVAGAQTSLAGGRVNVVPGEGVVSVEAEKPGESYNIGAATYSIDGAPAQIVGQGDQMAGGLTKEVKLVAEKDLADAEVNVKDALSAEIRQGLSEQAAKDGLIINDGVFKSEIVSVSHSKNVDDEADSFDTVVKIKVIGIGFKEKDLKAVIAKIFEREIGADKMLVNPDKASVTYSVSENDPDKGTLTLKANFAGRISQKLSQSEARALIRNKNKSEAANLLRSNQAIETAEIVTWPLFLNRTPLLANRIKINFDYAE
ncbi:MAG: hypothetical protein WCT32_03110 [Patescibacteria group bacterium]|jgi:hypothetical protein